MCNCYTEMCDKIKEKLHPESEFISDQNRELLSGKTFSRFEITLHGKKKPKTINILHSYCPHCGEKYDEDKEAQ